MKFYFLKLKDSQFKKPVLEQSDKYRWSVLIEGGDFLVVGIPDKDEETVKSLPGTELAGEVNLNNLRIKKIQIKEEK